MTMRGRLVTVLGAFLIAVVLVVWAVAGFLHPGVPGGVMDFTTTQAAGQPVNVTAQTVGSIGFGNHRRGCRIS
jgi:hypothetical protein